MNTSKEYIVLAVCGVLAAAVAISLAFFGNPANMAICVACFIRDTAGAMGLHSSAKVQYVRPEIICIVTGALIMALVSKEFRPQSGSSPATRFFIGGIMVIGALIFLGCPLRMVLRMSAGDLNAWIGLVGFAAGIATGVFFLKKGFSLGRAHDVGKTEGVILPVILVIVLILSVTTTLFQASTEGPGATHAALFISVIAGLVFGIIAQKSRMCFAAGLRDTFLVRDFSGLIVIAILFVGMLIYNLVTGNFKLGTEAQPIAHSQALWNILGLYVVGLAAVMLGGCPLRQLVLTGNGSGDAAATVCGMFVGAAIAHNFGLASSAEGATTAGQIACIACIVILLVIASVNAFGKKGA